MGSIEGGFRAFAAEDFMENLPHFPALSPPFVLFARGRVRVAGPMCRVRSRSFRIERIHLWFHKDFCEAGLALRMVSAKRV